MLVQQQMDICHQRMVIDTRLLDLYQVRSDHFKLWHAQEQLEYLQPSSGGAGMGMDSTAAGGSEIRSSNIHYQEFATPPPISKEG